MNRLLFIGSIIAVACAWPAAHPEGTHADRGAPFAVPATLPSYVGQDGTWELYSNHSWNAAPHGPAQEIAPTGAPRDVKGGDKQAFVWSHCEAGRQKIVFSRTVQLLGPPTRVAFHVYSRIRGRPATEGSARLTVNGTNLYHTTVYAYQPTDIALDGKKDLDAFRFGVNKIEMVVTKNAGVACKTGSANELFGVAWKLEGFSAADLAITKKSNVRYLQANPARHLLLQVPIRNNGPDAYIGADFSVTVQQIDNLHGDAILIHKLTSGSTYDSCTGPAPAGGESDAPPWYLKDQYTFQCHANKLFPPGTTTRIDFTVVSYWENGVDPTYHDWGDVTFLLSVRSTGAFYDPVAENDTRTSRTVFCGTNANNPACAHAEK